MTILVTGGAGYIGSHMVYALVDAGERVVVLDDLSTGFDWAVSPAALLVRGNAGDRTLVARLIAEHAIDSIIHFAASVIVPESVAEPLKYYRNNTATSLNLIECAVEGGVRRFVFSSTAAVYGNPASAVVTEDDPAAPMSPYGSSKLMTETMLRDASAAYSLDYVTLRYFNVAGADPLARTGESTKGSTHLITVAVETAIGLREKIEVFGTDYPTRDGTCIRDYIHVADLVAAHSQALAYLARGGRPAIFNCGYGRGYSVLEVIDTVKRVSGKDFRVDCAPRRPGDPAEIVASSGLIHDTLGWTPRFDDLSTIVAHALAWRHKLLARNAS
jgi:UDP-glucose 4-epimerase